MALRLTAVYENASELKRALVDYAAQGAMLLRTETVPDALQQFAPVELTVRLGDAQQRVAAEVLQTIAGVGVVVRLPDTSSIDALAGDAEPALEAPSPAVEQTAEAGATGTGGITMPAGMGPLSWPIEKLQAEFHTLSVSDKVRLAKYGKRHARGLIQRGVDKTLHAFLLLNNGVSPEEVAGLAAMASADPALLRRIGADHQWLRHPNIVRNLVCNPKMTIPQVVKLLDHLPREEMRRLSKTGRVRAAIKREIMRKLERSR